MRRAQHLPGPSYYEPPAERESWEERQARLDKEGDDAYEREVERELERKAKKEVVA